MDTTASSSYQNGDWTQSSAPMCSNCWISMMKPQKLTSHQTAGTYYPCAGWRENTGTPPGPTSPTRQLPSHRRPRIQPVGPFGSTMTLRYITKLVPHGSSRAVSTASTRQHQPPAGWSLDCG